MIEDDYDSEFRYDVAPLPALAQLDLDLVVHLGTLSKMLSPAMRLGWLVASAEVVDALTAYRERSGDWPSWPCRRPRSPCSATATSTAWYAEGAGATPRGATGCASASRRTGRSSGGTPACTSPWYCPRESRTESAARGPSGRSRVASLSEYRRSIPGPAGW